VRAAVVAERGTGVTYGYPTQSLIGALEVRYALVCGHASTFVTGPLAARLGLDLAGLREAALRGVEADGPPVLDPSPGESDVYRVRTAGDGAASLLSPDRMRALAALVGSETIDGAIPERGVLLVAKHVGDTNAALDRAAATPREGGIDLRRTGGLVYDTRNAALASRVTRR